MEQEQKTQPSPGELPSPDESISEEKPKKIKIGTGPRWQRFSSWYKSNKKKSIPLTILLLLLLIGLIPWTRYAASGLVIKKDLNLRIIDSTAGTPVSDVNVSVGSINKTTNGSGEVTFRKQKVGHRTVVINKKYYKGLQVKVLVPILKDKKVSDISINATGRQVKLSVTDVINQKTLDGVDIKITDIKAKTDEKGSAIVVLPVGTKSAKAVLSLDGYNSKSVDVKVSDKTIQENSFSLTPSGKVYFLSKLRGKIDVVKTNLDGSDRQTVVSGTGREEERGTVLLASRDWKYLALLSRRDPVGAKLYLVDTSDDSMSLMDSTVSASFNPVGWSDNNFIYTVNRQDVGSWQAGGQILKSYNAKNKQITKLDQTKAEGSGASDYAQEVYGTIYQLGKTIVYEKSWSAYYASLGKLNDKQAGIYSIGATGTNAQTLKTFGYVSGQNTYITSIPYEANQVYYQVNEKGATAYYAYSAGKVTNRNDLADEFNNYSQSNTTYLLSPSGNETFWSEQRDGKNTLFIGNSEGDNGKQIASLSDYQTYGWYSDKYLLVSKSGSELYAASSEVINEKHQPLKITDYHKPSRSFNGYGGGYGGI